jgi:hypothetical protein
MPIATQRIQPSPEYTHTETTSIKRKEIVFRQAPFKGVITYKIKQLLNIADLNINDSLTKEEFLQLFKDREDVDIIIL